MPKKGGVLKDLSRFFLGPSVLCLRKAAYSKIFRAIVVRPIRPMLKKGGVLKDLSRNCC